MKRQPGRDLLLSGGSGLAAALTELGLIDEYHIAVHPVVLGSRRLFPISKDRLDMRLAETRTFDSRTVLLHCRRAERDE